MAPSRLLLALAVLTLSSTAAAEKPAKEAVRVARAAVLIQQAGNGAVAATTQAASEQAGEQKPEAEAAPVKADAVAKAEAHADATQSKAEAPAPAPQRAEAPAAAIRSCDIGTSCGYRSMLGRLVITKDILIPGLSSVSLRLIPTKSAIGGGTSAPIVLKPRVIGTSWSGLEVAAQF